MFLFLIKQYFKAFWEQIENFCARFVHTYFYFMSLRIRKLIIMERKKFTTEYAMNFMSNVSITNDKIDLVDSE